jgi:hypothetical protein
MTIFHSPQLNYSTHVGMEKALKICMLPINQATPRFQHKCPFVFIHTYQFQTIINPEKGGG